MRFEGAHALTLSVEETASRLRNPSALYACVPGLEQLDPKAEQVDAYDAVLELRLPAITGRFEGVLQFLTSAPPEQLRMRVRGKGAVGFVDGTVEMELESTEAGTNLDWTAEVQLGGTIARLGQRMLSGVTREMASQFFSALSRWDPAAPDEKVVPSAAQAAAQVAGATVKRSLGLRRDEE